MPLPLATERLLLRPATLDEVEDWLTISRDAEEAWYGTASSTVDDGTVLAKHIQRQEEHGLSIWSVENRATGEVIGCCGLTHLEDGPEIEVGYRFKKKHWGRGYATESAHAAVAFGFDELGLERIVAVTRPDNRASRRVMEKCGMSFVGVTHVYGHAQVKYALAR